MTAPVGVLDGLAVEDRGLNPVDYLCPERQLADDFVKRAAGDEPFLVDVGKPIECCAEETEEVTFDLVAARCTLRVGIAIGGDVI